MYHTAGFTDQAPVEVDFFGYRLLIPSQHVLTAFFDPQSPMHQPYRETGLVRIAQALQLLNRSGTAIDIGANVGDTCAILHRHSALKIVSIDASDFFFPYLEKNVERLFGERASARQAFVLAAGDETPRGLFHWGGTAKAVDAPFSEHCQSIAICDLLASVGDVALLKVDIDGFDIEVISGAFDNVGVNGHQSPRFPIYFEYEFAGDNLDQIRARCIKSLEFFKKVADAGYIHAFVWDDPGRFVGLLDTRRPEDMINAINYMGHFRHRSVYGYDICLVHQSDAALASTLSAVVSSDLILPVQTG